MTIHRQTMPWTLPVPHAAQEPVRHPAQPTMCPVCRRHGTLIALGGRIDHPYRWRRWVAMATDIYLCNRCDALVEVGATTGTTHTPSGMTACGG